MSIIEFNKVSEKYRIKFINEGKVWWEEISALDGISFKLDRGEVLGVIGKNGAGKTTLLKLIAGMLIPDKGEIRVEGRVSTLMEPGAGFNAEFTGKENILLNARIYGIEEHYLNSRMEEIIEFAGLGKFINAPVKYYSQGMFMRLAFALAIYVEPDILLIDDILAVGDREAQSKCIKKVFELKKRGKTIVVVSHDMEMIKRLCERVILLDKGSIIEEGFPEEAISQYMMICIDEQRIKLFPEKDGPQEIYTISAGRLSLSADSNAKSLRLYYQDKELTRGSGLHSSFLSERGWFGIKEADWNIENNGEGIIIRFSWALFKVTQIWWLAFKNDVLLWRINHENRKKLNSLKFGLLLRPEYKKCFCRDKEINFPSEFIGWQDLVLEEATQFGVRKQGEFPALVISSPEGKRILALVQNSDCISTCRALQVVVSEPLLTENRLDISLQLSFLEEESDIETYINEEKQKKEKLKEYGMVTEREPHTIRRGDLGLYADIKAKVLRLYYRGRELTQGSGLHTAIYFGKEYWADSVNTEWQIQKISDKELILISDRGSFDTLLSLSQIWHLSFVDNSTLKINIELEVKKPFSSICQDVKVELINAYERWFTAYEKGDFPIVQFIENITPVRLRNNKVSKLVLKPIADKTLPKLSLDFSSEANKRIISIHKRKTDETEYIAIHSSLLRPRKEQMVLSGKYSYFEGNITVGKQIKLVENYESEIIQRNRGKLELVFEHGKGRIFWRQHELTAGLGIYSSLRLSGIWYDSSQAIWQLIEKNNYKLVVLGDWPYIPLTQTWELELIDEKSILWKIETEVYEELNLELMQANLMLVNKYKNWTVGGVSQGEFPDEFTKDYDILPYRCWYGLPKQEGIAATDNILPNIIFLEDTENKSLKAIVENTDSLHQARLLQYQRVNSLVLLSQKFCFFKGIVKIKPNE